MIPAVAAPRAGPARSPSDYGRTTSSEITTGRLVLTADTGVGTPALGTGPGAPPGPDGSTGAAAPPGNAEPP